MFATPEGYSVADGSSKGGLFLRNVCKVFKDKEFVKNHYWNKIVLKIRNYTKREATLVCNLLEFTQVVETEDTLEKLLKFYNKIDYNESKLDDTVDDTSEKTLILTNVSPNRICVLIENENSSEDRIGLWDELSKDSSLELFIKNGYHVIEPNGDFGEFTKPYSDRLFISLFLISDNPEESTTPDELHSQLYDRYGTKDDYLYFQADALRNFDNLRLKCDLNNKHYLVESRSVSGGDNTGKCKNCASIANGIYYDYSMACPRCRYELCQQCCHALVIDKYVPSSNSSNISKNEDDYSQNSDELADFDDIKENFAKGITNKTSQTTKPQKELKNKISTESTSIEQPLPKSQSKPPPKQASKHGSSISHPQSKQRKFKKPSKQKIHAINIHESRESKTESSGEDFGKYIHTFLNGRIPEKQETSEVIAKLIWKRKVKLKV